MKGLLSRQAAIRNVRAVTGWGNRSPSIRVPEKSKPQMLSRNNTHSSIRKGSAGGLNVTAAERSKSVTSYYYNSALDAAAAKVSIIIMRPNFPESGWGFISVQCRDKLSDAIQQRSWWSRVFCLTSLVWLVSFFLIVWLMIGSLSEASLTNHAFCAW